MTRVLKCGLKDFCTALREIGDYDVTTHQVSMVASVVGILGHLASRHQQDIQHALMKLFRVSGRSSLSTNLHVLCVVIGPVRNCQATELFPLSPPVVLPS